MDNTLKIFCGVLVSLLASLLDALGLNIQKRDHIKASTAVKPRHECLRIYWHLGLYLYCGSQAIGNSVALQLLKAQWIAPLGALSLVFNFIFARFLVGTIITKSDVIGTLIILCAILLIVLMGAFFGPQEDIEANLDLEILKELLQITTFKAYFSSLNIIAFGLFVLGIYTKWFLENDKDPRESYIFNRIRLPTLYRVFGISISALGGIFASETLILAKSGIKLILEAFKNPASLGDIVSIVIVIALVATCILQIYCLNAGLKFADSVVAVPVFACTYNVFGLANSMIYFNQFKDYPWYVHLTSVIGVILLILGIVILAKQEKAPPKKIPKFRIKKLKANLFNSKDKNKKPLNDHYPIEVIHIAPESSRSSIITFPKLEKYDEETSSAASYTTLLRNKS